MSRAAIASAVDRIYAVFGMAALFAARDDAARACTVLVDTNLSQYGDVARVAGKTVVVSVRATEVPDLPRKGDVFEVTAGEYAGRSFRVDSVVQSDALEHRVFAA